MREVLLGIIAAVLLSVTIFAQNSPLRFEVASVKPVTWQLDHFHGGGCHGIDSNHRAEVNTRPVPWAAASSRMWPWET